MSSPQRDQNIRMLQAIVLCLIVAFIYQRIFIPPKKPAPQQVAQTATVSPTHSVSTSQPIARNTPGQVQILPSTQNVTARTHPKRSDLEQAGFIEVETSDYIVRLSKLGGRVVSFRLKEYKLHGGADESLDLVDSPDSALTPLALYIGASSDEYVNYSLTSVTESLQDQNNSRYKLAENSTGVLTLSGQLEDGTQIVKKLELTDGAYLLSLNVELSKPTPDGRPVWAEWSHYFSGEDLEPRIKLTDLMVLDGFSKLQRVPLAEVQQGTRDYGTSQWVSIGDLYFMSTLIPTVQGRNTILGREDHVYFARIAGTPSGGLFKFYVGPKDYRNLAEVGYGLERSIDLGIFTFLAYPLLWTIHYLYLLLGNYGLAIIVLTLIVKTLMLPLTKVSLESMKKMQDIQPEMKALRERIKDPTQLNQEIFALYKRKGVNPVSGCFPILIQIPVFLGLYQALLNSIELRHAPFALWITDLSAPEKLYVLGIPIPVMVLLMAFSMVVQQWTSPPPSDPAQAQAMKIMPIIFAIMFIIFPMPAGLVLYWLVNNLISITQQVYLRRANSNSAYQATLVASVVIFVLGYVLTLI